MLRASIGAAFSRSVSRLMVTGCSETTHHISQAPPSLSIWLTVVRRSQRPYATMPAQHHSELPEFYNIIDGRRIKAESTFDVCEVQSGIRHLDRWPDQHRSPRPVHLSA